MKTNYLLLPLFACSFLHLSNIQASQVNPDAYYDQYSIALRHNFQLNGEYSDFDSRIKHNYNKKAPETIQFNAFYFNFSSKNRNADPDTFYKKCSVADSVRRNSEKNVILGFKSSDFCEFDRHNPGWDAGDSLRLSDLYEVAGSYPMYKFTYSDIPSRKSDGYFTISMLKAKDMDKYQKKNAAFTDQNPLTYHLIMNLNGKVVSSDMDDELSASAFTKKTSKMKAHSKKHRTKTREQKNAIQKTRKKTSSVFSSSTPFQDKRKGGFAGIFSPTTPKNFAPNNIEWALSDRNLDFKKRSSSSESSESASSSEDSSSEDDYGYTDFKSKTSHSAHGAPTPEHVTSVIIKAGLFTVEEATYPYIKNPYGSHKDKKLIPVRKGWAQDTINAIKHGYHVGHDFVDPTRDLGGRVTTKATFLNPLTTPSANYSTVISFQNARSLRVFMHEKLSDPNEKIAVINFGDKTRPGGGFFNGKIAQEENCCHESTLNMDLYPNSSALYPIGHTEIVMTQNAKLIRDPSEYKTHNSRSFIKPLNIDLFLTQAAYNLYSRMHDNDISHVGSNIKPMTKDKIRYQLRAASSNGCTTLITGAFGCGVFQNDPLMVGNCYAEVLQEAEFKGRFKKVIFAIPEDHKTGTKMTAFKAAF